MTIHTIRKRFVRDQGLPIQLLQDPYFSYYLDLYENMLKSRTLYEIYVQEVDKKGGAEAFLMYYNQRRETIIQHVEAKPSYQRFNEDKLDGYNIKGKLPKSNLYNEGNHQQDFLSIDLKKANFHALRYYDPDIVDQKRTYEEWIGSFTSSTSIASSKYFRQVVFGNLNPKKQQKIQNYITHSFLEILENMVGLEHIMSASHDEIIVRNPTNIPLVQLKGELENRHNGAFPLHMDMFTLHKQTAHEEFGYVKEYKAENRVEFKGVPAYFMAQAYKHYFNLDLSKEDLLFYHEGQIATFLKPAMEGKESE